MTPYEITKICFSILFMFFNIFWVIVYYFEQPVKVSSCGDSASGTSCWIMNRPHWLFIINLIWGILYMTLWSKHYYDNLCNTLLLQIDASRTR